MKIPFAFRSQGLFIKTLPWSLLLLPGSYNGSGTWTGTASAGTSGSTNFVDTGGAPAGLASNYATFNGTTQKLLSTFQANTLVAQAGSTIITIVRFHATGYTNDAVAPTAGAYLGPDTQLAYGLGHGSSSTDGLYSFCNNSSNSAVAATKQGISLNTWYLHIGRWNSTNIRERLNTTDATNGTLSGGAGSQTVAASNKLLVGAGGSGFFHNMDLRLVAIAPSVISDADCTNIYNEALGNGWLS